MTEPATFESGVATLDSGEFERRDSIERQKVLSYVHSKTRIN